VPFQYQPPGANELRQGEILGPVVDLRTSNAAATINGEEALVDRRPHVRVLVMTADCDLLRDFENRLPGVEQKIGHRLEHILICDVYTIDELNGVTSATYGTREWKFINANGHERYHRFPEAVIGIPIQPADGTPAADLAKLPELYLDFKRSFGIPAESLYDQITAGLTARVARVPDVYIQDLAHRLYGFLSRVGPDFEGIA
jgi:hypothetical protein